MTIDTSGAPFDVDGVTYVALAPVVRNAGGTVSWDNEAKKANVTLGMQSIAITMTDPVVVIDGANVTLSNPPLVVDGTLIVPQEFFTTALKSPS